MTVFGDFALAVLTQSTGMDSENDFFLSHKTILSLEYSFNVFDYFLLYLCIGSASSPYDHPYVLTQARTLTHQDCAECFISQDYYPCKPLPYCSNCKGMQNKIDSLKDEGLMQSILNHVLSLDNAKEILHLLSSYFSNSMHL